MRTAFILLAAVSSVATGILSAAPPVERAPNILLITIDTLRADHLSCYGYPRQTSPYIDGLAQEGTRFSRAYTVIPLTGPAHLSLFTGRYPQENGVRRNGASIPDDRKIVVLPQVFRSHGYQTAAFISAWPLAGHLTHLNRYFGRYDEDLNRTYQMFNSSRYAEDVTPKALKWLKGHSQNKKPFFLWVHYFDPHSPYEQRDGFEPPDKDKNHPYRPNVSDEMLQRFNEYDSEIYYADHYLGKLLEALDAQNLRDSTIVVLTADHGESLGQHDYVGHGRQIYEDTIHIPLIVRYPGRVKAGQVIDTPVSIIDIAPTLLDLTVKTHITAKKQKSVPLTFSGRSLASTLTTGENPSQRWVYFVTFAGKKGFAPSWLSRVWVHDDELPLLCGRLDGYSKMIWDPNDDKLSLFDLRSDPRELKGAVLAENDPKYTSETAQLERWFSRTQTRAVEQPLSAHDVEVLKSLGYIQ